MFQWARATMLWGFLKTILESWHSRFSEVSAISEQVTNLHFVKLQTKQNWEVGEVLIPAALLKFDTTMSYWGSANTHGCRNWLRCNTGKNSQLGSASLHHRIACQLDHQGSAVIPQTHKPGFKTLFFFLLPFTSNVHHLVLSSEPIIHFGHVVDVLAYKYVRLVVFTPIHGKMCSYIGLLILSFLQHRQPKTKRKEGGNVTAPPFKPKHWKKKKKNHSRLSLTLRFPKHTETFLYTLK